MGTISFLGILNDRGESGLISAINNIMDKASAHLKGVPKYFPEYTVHDETHSRNVLEIMEKLIGENAKELSSYELFSLIAVAYLHDCGMAISDYENNVLNLANKMEGTLMLNYDGAIDIINKNKSKIYPGGFKGEISNWWFVPKNEKTLKAYFVQLLQGYQEYRNKKIDKILESKNKKNTNKELMTDYLRSTHHTRIEKYICFLKDDRYFCEQIKNWASLAEYLAKICRAHGEDKEYIEKKLDTYIFDEDQGLNTQFVAMMLRIGDIADFCSERAPIVLRALHIYQSNFSLTEWKKQEHINRSILTKKKQISYNTHFTNPQYYYAFHMYVDEIDKELGIYAQLRAKWENSDFSKLQEEKSYTKLNEKVFRGSIKYDDSKFIPTSPIMSFILNQERIIDLLMGKKLYKNKYACLRELFQNSLDACRYKISLDKANGKTSTGNITFGLSHDSNGRKYVYCLDNGIGMTKSIIKNYLLKIGNSYYKSQEFYRDQAITGNKFSPISQFGIGILSCYMIGNEIEIITKNDKDDCISCAMPQKGFFYYKNIDKGDCEKVSKPSGTLIKIYLNDEGLKLNDKYFKDLCFHIIRNRAYRDPNNPNEDPLWINNLYHIINDFVSEIPDGINIYVKLENKRELQVFKKPLVIGQSEQFKIKENEYKTFSEALKFLTGYKKAVTLEIENAHNIILEKEENGIQYKYCLLLLNNGFEYKNEMDLNTIALPIHRANGFCINGIRLNVEPSLARSFFRNMGKYGIVNFCGKNQPTISIDRDSIIEDDLSRYDSIAKKLLEGIIDKGMLEICNYINNNCIEKESFPYYYAWRSFFFKFRFCIDILLDRILRNKTICEILISAFKNKEYERFEKVKTDFGTIYPSLLQCITTFYNNYLYLEGQKQTCKFRFDEPMVEIEQYKTKIPSFYLAIKYGLLLTKKDQDDFSISIIGLTKKKPQ